MKHFITAFALVLSLIISAPALVSAATPQEKAFVDAYKKAFESKDEATLKSFLYTKGADPDALAFYTMMITAEMGEKLASIELRELTAEEKTEAAAVMPSPTGGQSKLPVTPTKKLVLKIESKDANGSSTSTNESFIAEVDGKYMIPVPVTVK